MPAFNICTELNTQFWGECYGNLQHYDHTKEFINTL